jgi:hypothetical protein
MHPRVESDADFNRRIDAEDREASAVRCPLATCQAPVGFMCRTEAGVPRIRHCRRLMVARKQNGESHPTASGKLPLHWNDVKI